MEIENQKSKIKNATILRGSGIVAVTIESAAALASKETGIHQLDAGVRADVAGAAS